MRQIRVIAIVLLLVVINMGKIYGQYSQTKWLDGNWTGIGYQPDALSKNAWSINLVYNYSKEEIKIDYPSFPCNGYWKLQKADENKAVFIEYITDGKSRCQDGGTVIVTKIDGDFITISYFLPNIDPGVIAFSTLQKQH